MFSRCLIVYCALLTFPLLADEKSKLLDDAKEGWAELNDFYGNLEARMAIDAVNPNGLREQNGKYVYKVKGDKQVVIKETGLFENLPQRRITTGKVLGVNSAYAFAVTRFGDDWVSDDVITEQSLFPALRRGHRGHWFKFFSVPFMVSIIPFKQLVEHPGFTLDSRRTEHRDGHECEIVEFTFKPSAQEMEARNVDQTIWALRGGSIVFCPKASWCVLETELDVEPEKGKQLIEKTSVVYEDLTKPIPVLKSMKRTWTPGSSDASLEILSLNHRDVDDSEFTLSALGLPEPVVKQDKPHPSSSTLVLWSSALTLGVALVVTFILTRKGRPR